MRSNLVLSVGLVGVVCILVFGYLGPFFVDRTTAQVGAVLPKLAPSIHHLLGTDTQGRDVFTVFVLATGETLTIAFIAAGIGTVVGTALGLIAGYSGGIVDGVLRTISDVALTIPGLILLVIIGADIRVMTVHIMAFIVAALAWMGPMRTVRSQILTLRERTYIKVAHLNGVSGPELLLTEMLPIVAPYVVARFVMAVSVAILATIGLEALGLGPQDSFTLGMMVYWFHYYNAILRGFWWWWAPPIFMIILIFISLYLLSTGLDRFANPRLRRDG